MYRNLRWNLRLIPYAALNGVAMMAVVPVMAVQALPLQETTGTRLMIGILCLAVIVPVARMLVAVVKVDERSIVIRNPFRTYSIPTSEIREIGASSLWQNFVVVTSVTTTRSRTVPLVGVPPDDAQAIATLIAGATEGE